MDIRTLIDARVMTRYQWFIIAIATFLNAMDGYDILAMAFTANSVAAEFGLSGSQLGLVISLGFIGMGVGSLTLGPLGDRLGRRPILLAALTLDGIGLLWSGVAGSATELGMARLLTGIGVGGVLTVVTVITSEYSNKRNRGMAISIYAAGYGVGATLGGLLAAQLIPTVGWRVVFLAGAALSAVG
ncbi:MAG: MFS transporter, partial [Corynebacterium sp.]|nr:MFS transporter [Corynebacterium sp.]